MPLLPFEMQQLEEFPDQTDQTQFAIWFILAGPHRNVRAEKTPAPIVPFTISIVATRTVAAGATNKINPRA